MTRWVPMLVRPAALLLVFLSVAAPAAGPLSLEGSLAQGGLVWGRTAPDAVVSLDGQSVRVSPEGLFVVGFTREAPPRAELAVRFADGTHMVRPLEIARREYEIQRIDGLPQKMVTPPADVLARIARERDRIEAARARDTAEPLFASGWIWPAKGRISGVYGSQRILNGEPRQPHYGIDVAAPTGTPVVAPADGVVTLAADDLYYTGGTVILDHGHGLSSAFLHLSAVAVKEGDRLARGDPIGRIGATGRATGAHLDWRINWFDRRIDPAFLVPPMTAE